MEEKKQNAQGAPKKLSYEELAQAASDLQMSNQKLYARVQQLQEALEHREFEFTSFVLNALFKVVEHAEMYPADFLEKCIGNIVGAITEIIESNKPQEEEQKDVKAE